jgi:hypothetical protein
VAREKFEKLFTEAAELPSTHRLRVDYALTSSSAKATSIVMPALVAGIHVFLDASKAWMAGTARP